MRTIRMTNQKIALSNVDYVACGLDLLKKKADTLYTLSFSIHDIQDEIRNAFGVDLRYDQVYNALRHLCKLNEVFCTGKSMKFAITYSGMYRTEMIRHTNENVERVYDEEGFGFNESDIEDDADDVDDEYDEDDVDDEVEDEDVETHDNAFNKSIMDSISTSLSACAKSLEQVANILKMMK